MDNILTQIPGYEFGAVEALRTTTEDCALYNTARSINELLNKWNTNVAFITLANNSTSMKRRVRNRSKVAKFYAVVQDNPNLEEIISVVEELANTKFVRAFFIFGLPARLNEVEMARLEQLAKSISSYMDLVTVVDQAFFDEELAKLDS